MPHEEKANRQFAISASEQGQKVSYAKTFVDRRQTGTMLIVVIIRTR